jgi:uncharacterized membrane protein
MESVKSPDNILIKVIAALSVALLIIGVLFKIMHWPLANMAMLGGYLGIALTYPKMLISNPKRTKDEIAQAIGLFIFGAFNAVYMIVSIEHGRSIAYGYNILKIMAFVGLLVFIIFKIKVFAQPSQGGKKGNPPIIIALFVLGATGLGLGMFFKYLHWPFANILIIVGGGFGLLWYLSDIFYPDEEKLIDDDDLLD